MAAPRPEPASLRIEEVLAEYHQALLETDRRAAASEGSRYRPLERLLEGVARSRGIGPVQALALPNLGGTLCPDVQVLAGSGRIVGYVEAKLPGTDLRTVAGTPQLRRYLKSFPNLLLTDFRAFTLFRDEDPVASVGSQWTDAGGGDGLVPLLESFLGHDQGGSRSAVDLATALARRTRHLKDMIEALLGRQLAVSERRERDEPGGAAGELAGFYRAFHDHLIADLSPAEFADLYAQTLAFGLFAARTRLGSGFSLSTAGDAVPETVGILRDAFRYVCLADPPKEVRWILHDLVELLRATDVDRIFERWFHEGRGSDPIVHFYETFLEAYDSEERERRGVFYTPLPLVSYVVRSVHRLLRKPLGFRLGLASPRVRLLDPAAGTLPFLTESWKVAREAFGKSFGTGSEGALVRDHLLPHFYGFELMMAPYAVGHLKVDYLLREWSVSLSSGERCGLFLANTLGGALRQSDLPGMASLSRESREAERVKREVPVNVVVGNPPYRGHSANQDGWIDELAREGYERPAGPPDDGYYRVEGAPLGERNPKWLQDDYVKFLRFAQWKVDQAGEGVVGLVINHGYLDNPTFRGLRESLLQSFDQLYLLDLHGNAKKREMAPDGRADENVFAIQQGVSVALLVKKPGLRKGVFRADLHGPRREKLDWLGEHDVASTPWTEIRPRGPYFLFAPLDPGAEERYRRFVPLPELFPVHSVGVVTARDHFALALDHRTLLARIDRFAEWAPDLPVAQVWPSLKKTRAWDPDEARRRVWEDPAWRERLVPILHRPFDRRWIFYSDAVVERPRRAVLEHMLRCKNLGLVVPRQGRGGGGALVTEHLVGHKAVSAYDVNTLFPLYLAPEAEWTGPLFEGAPPDPRAAGVKPNLGRAVALLRDAYGQDPGPQPLLAYVYAVLHAPAYREGYAALLELDFPRVPFPREPERFRALAALGQRLVDLHLLRAPELESPTVRLEGPERPARLSHRPTEYRPDEARVEVTRAGHAFVGLSPEVWAFEVGGYPVLERWLRARSREPLSREIVETFAKTASALAITLELQREIDRLYATVEDDLLPFGG